MSKPCPHCKNNCISLVVFDDEDVAVVCTICGLTWSIEKWTLWSGVLNIEEEQRANEKKDQNPMH